MTELQMFIIRYILNMFSDKNKLNKICEEYKEIYNSDLKDDWEKWRKDIGKIMKGK